MSKCECKFYELDVAEKAELDSMNAAYFANMSQAEREATEAWATQNNGSEPCELDKCGECCKFLKSGKGYPSEYLYYCEHPENHHIIHADFNESEII